MPWTGMVVYRSGRGGWEEVVCAENNRSFEDGTVLAQIPVAAKPDF
jgi:hypothetical protein